MRQRTHLAIVMMLIVSVAINVALAYKLRQFNRLLGIRSVQMLKPGNTVLPFQAVDLTGLRHTVAYNEESRPVVLYVFTPPCSWCARNVDNLKALAAQKDAEYRFIGLSLSEKGLADYVEKNQLKLRVYSGLSPETLETYKLGSTPQTIVISHDGKVLQDWVGAWVGDQKSQVEAFFHVTLPGLREISKAASAKQNEVQPQAVN